MEVEPKIDEINSSPIVASHVVTVNTSDDEDTIETTDRQNSVKKRKQFCFEWIHLIATIWIPIVIAVYTIVENNNNQSNAAKNRLKDMEIANISRTSELQIAQDNRLNEMAIAELSRQKDRDLAIDQQHQNILIEYQMFLAKLIIDYGTNLSNKPEAKLAAQFMTLTALNQLDTKRRSILLRSLFDAKLITLRNRDLPPGVSTINLQQVDLRNIIFGLSPNEPNILPRNRYIRWNYLWLNDAILKNASFRHTILDCVSFAGSFMDSADLSFATQVYFLCFNGVREAQTDFQGASLVNASLYETHFRFTSFNAANLTFANMYGIYCLECNFSMAILFHVDLRFSEIYHGFVLHKERLDFRTATLSQADVRSARYISINFDKSDWSNVQASQIFIRNCTFINARMDSCSFMNSYIYGSVFQNASLYAIDFSSATLWNVTFTMSDMRNANLSNIKCDYCDFTNVTLHGAVLKNASIRHSNFLNCHVDASQLEEALDLSGSTLPDGTVIKSKN